MVLMSAWPIQTCTWTMLATLIASVGVGRENGRAALAGEHVAYPRDVTRKRGLREAEVR